MNRNVSRLNPLLGVDERCENAIDDIEDACVAAKIRCQPALDSVLRFDDFLNHFEISLDIRAPKRIDRLFRVADDENFSGGELDLAPVFDRMIRLLGKVEQNLILNR